MTHDVVLVGIISVCIGWLACSAFVRAHLGDVVEHKEVRAGPYASDGGPGFSWLQVHSWDSEARDSRGRLFYRASDGGWVLVRAQPVDTDMTASGQYIAPMGEL